MSKESCIQMVKDNHFCVLSTSKNNLPNSSLMLYLSNEEGDTLYMVTRKGSLKHANVVENPEVSLLIDTRENIKTSYSSVRALTAYGTASIIGDQEEESALFSLLTEKHPDLSVFSRMKDACIIKVTVKKFLYLDGIEDAKYYTLPESP